MSASRRYRREAGRWLWRQPGVEPSAETRAWVARMIGAHDDDTVSLAEFLELGRRWADYMAPLPEAERVEAALQVNDHAMRNLLGRKVRSVAVERRQAPATETRRR